MTCFLLLLGLLFKGGCTYPVGSCDGYTNISQTWRNIAVTSTNFPEYPYDDAGLVGSWWRFVGIGGDRLTWYCPALGWGGTSNPLFVDYDYASNPTGPILVRINYADVCQAWQTAAEVVYCPGDFYVYKTTAHPTATGKFGYVTAHGDCSIPNVCGPDTVCTNYGGCLCAPGYTLGPDSIPTETSYGCIDIDECVDTTLCGPNSVCTNLPGQYNCSCQVGYSTFNTAPPNSMNDCKDVDECVQDPSTCGPEGTCTNSIGSYICTCTPGYQPKTPTMIISDANPCTDIDECLDTTLCGPNSVCTNLPGQYNCSCQVGYSTFNTAPPNSMNDCKDVDECVEDPSTCGPEATCTNSIGSYICTCTPGYRPKTPTMIASDANPCTDIDECSETPDICGYLGVCTNVPGTFSCSCPEGAYPSTGVLWAVGVTFCRAIPDILDEIIPPEGQTAEMTFLIRVDQQLKDNADVILPEVMVANCFSACMEVAGVGPRVKPVKVSSAGDGESGSVIQDIAKRLINALVLPDHNLMNIELTTSTMDLNMCFFGPEIYKPKNTSVSANGNFMEINMESLARNNNDSAAAAFLVLNGMESLLSHQYFETENRTEMVSDVITAFLPTMNNTKLTEPVNFTLQHKEVLSESGVVTCVFWEVDIDPLIEKLKKGEEEPSPMGWSVEGCWVSYSNENYTVCSCSHLSTFALILQTAEPPPQNDFLDWLNRICVIIGLFFFTLAILTFLLCSWNPKINNTARLHLCLNLGLSHLLLLLNDVYVANELACKTFAGILHFLVVASFVWMLLEAVQLYMLVHRLNKVQVIERDGLPKPVLYIIGYGVPFVIVGVSALVYHPGYGATAAKVCWLTQTRNFNWALTGPVITVLVLNLILFCATLWSLRTILANMRSGASESKDTKLVLFKIVAQFVILGCTWILGLYQSNLFFQILFIVLNSQQGTFLYFVHCVLNKEIREECLKWLTCSHNRNNENTDVVSTTENMDKSK